MNVKFKNYSWLMNVKPLCLREKIFYRFFLNKKDYYDDLFITARLEFAPQVSLELKSADVSHKTIAFCGFYELPVTRYIAKLAKLHGGLMVDVGANYGYYSCLWAGLQTNNHVIAFEASPRNIAPLKNNIIRNKLQSNIEVCEKAVGKKPGSLFFDLGPDDQSGWGGLTISKYNNSIEVSIVTLDDLFSDNKYDQIDVLKIDTEGSDAWVIEGAERLLRSHKIRHIFFEENLIRMSALSIKPGSAQKLLNDFGYETKRLAQCEWYAKPIRT